MTFPQSAIIETTVTVPALIGIPGPQGATGPAGPPGTQEFTVAGNSGPAQTISNGDTLTLTSPVSFQQVVMSAVDTATLSWPNQTGNVFLASPSDGSAGTPSFRTIVFADLDAVLGTMAQQDANAVAITGGTLSVATLLASTIASTAVRGVSTNLYGVQGQSTTAYGVYGISSGSYGVFGTSTNNAGVLGSSVNSYGMYVTRNTASPTSAVPVFYVLQDHASDPNAAALIRQDGAGDILRLSQGSDAGVLWSVASTGLQTSTRLDAGTNDTQSVMILGRNSTGTPAANFASRLLWQLESSTTENRDAASIVTSYVVATDASRTVRQIYNVNDAGGAREAMRLEASGSAPMIGFLGANAVIRQVLGTWAGLTTDQKLDALRDALTNLGLTSYT